MESFQQVCPECNSTLELPREADGKAAICPACQAEFIARAPESARQVAAEGPQFESSSESQLQGVSSSEPVAAAAPLPLTTQREPYRQVSIESILGDTQTVLSDRRRPLLLPFLIPSILILAGLVVPLAYLSDLVARTPMRGLIWTAVLLPWFVLVASYSLWFALNLSIDVCNAGPEGEHDRPEPIRSWFVPSLRVFIMLVVIVACGFVVLAVAVGISALVVNSVGAIRATELRVLITVAAVGGSSAGITLLVTRLWPLIPMAVEDPMRINMIEEAFAMTRPNLLTSFLMTIALFFVLGVGFSLFGLGLPIAIPIAALTLIVAYRLVAGKRIPAFDREEFA